MRILLIDDHAILRAGLSHILHDEFPDAEIGEACDTGEALKQLNAAPWDILLLDISLPGRSGLDLLPEIRSKWPASKIIVLSSFGDQQFAVRALREGASAFLTKEKAARELLDAIATVNLGRRFITSDLAEQLASLTSSERPLTPHELLSKREFEVFLLISSARTPTEIATQLSISPKTVSTYRTRILEKMNMTTNAEVMQYAIRHDLVR